MQQGPAEIKYTQLFINNQFVDGVKGTYIPLTNPLNEEEFAKISEATEEDVEIAVRAAEEAYTNTWSKTSLDQRNRLLLKLADLIEKNAAYLAHLECYNTGRPAMVSEADMFFGARHFRFFAGAADKVFGKTVQNMGDVFCYTRKEPYGVVALISPWNFPLLMAIWKMAAPLAAGNTLVLKPSEITPLTQLYFGSLVVEAGFPPGVINIVPGYGHIAGETLSRHPRIGKISFTGSTLIGRRILKASSETNLKKVSLELGGKSPYIVFNDANLDKVFENIFLGAFWNASQCCIAGSRVFVQEGIYEKFLERYKQTVCGFKVGCYQDGGNLGPMITRLQFQKVMEFLQTAKEEGLTALVGGNRHGDKGFFIQPTVFINVPDSSKLVKEEIFGPVSVVLTPFKTVEEVIERANNTPYGLWSSVFTENVNTIEKCVREIKAGTVTVNFYRFPACEMPFCGYKESGFGTDNGVEAVEDYLRTKVVYHKFDL